MTMMTATARRTGRSPGRSTFVVGRRTASTTEIQWVRPRPAPLPGPWGLRAVVRRVGEGGPDGPGALGAAGTGS